MKKSFWEIAGLAALSISMSAAPCTSGQTVDALRAAHFSTACTVGANNQWDLTNFMLDSVVQSGYSTQLTASDIVLTFANVGLNGFSITYTLAAGASNNFFTVDPSNSQSISWRNGIWITGTAGNASEINVAINEFVMGTAGTSDMKFKEVVQGRPGGITQGELLLRIDNGTVLPPGNSTSLKGTGGYGNALSVNYRPDFTSVGRSSTSNVLSYSTTFLVESPEPLTVGLMGFGLLGIAILRRRSA